MFFISTQPRFIRGVVLPWVVSFLKTNLIMPLRKFYLKIHVGTCCSQPHPADSWEGLHSTVAAAQSTQPHLPSPQTRQWGFSLSMATPPMTWEISQTHDICQIPRETPYSGLISGFMERRGRGMWAGSCTPKTYSVVGWTGIWCYKSLIRFMKSTRAKYYS